MERIIQILLRKRKYHSQFSFASEKKTIEKETKDTEVPFAGVIPL